MNERTDPKWITDSQLRHITEKWLHKPLDVNTIRRINEQIKHELGLPLVLSTGLGAGTIRGFKINNNHDGIELDVMTVDDWNYYIETGDMSGRPTAGY